MGYYKKDYDIEQDIAKVEKRPKMMYEKWEEENPNYHYYGKYDDLKFVTGWILIIISAVIIFALGYMMLIMDSIILGLLGIGIIIYGICFEAENIDAMERYKENRCKIVEEQDNE